MPAIIGLSLYVVTLVTTVCMVGAATIPPLSNPPKDDVSLGNTYVDAWQTFRIDLDTLNHGNVHPAVVHQWLNEASESLLTDIVNNAVDPAMVLNAGRRLAKQKNADIKLLRSLARRWSSSPLHAQFLALRVLANDKKYVSKLTHQIGSRSVTIRLNAAEILAFASNLGGKSELLRQIQNCGPLAHRAAKVLARIGNEADKKTLEIAIHKNCAPSILQAASGEILFRTLYPFYYDMLVRRDPSETRYHSENGMYSTWFQLVRFAVGQKVQSPSAFSGYLSRFKQFSSVWPSQNAQVAKRNVDALKSFFGHVTQQLKTNSPAVTWPRDFKDAVKSLGDISPKGFQKRVSAAISLLDFTEQKLHINEINKGTQFSVLSPRGSRVTDGNWRTSWQGVKGDPLVLEWLHPANIKDIWLATSCSQDNGTQIKKVDINIKTKENAPPKTVALNQKSRFYQRIPVNQQGVKKISIVITETTSRQPACISELRVTTI